MLGGITFLLSLAFMVLEFRNKQVIGVKLQTEELD